MCRCWSSSVCFLAQLQAVTRYTDGFQADCFSEGDIVPASSLTSNMVVSVPPTVCTSSTCSFLQQGRNHHVAFVESGVILCTSTTSTATIRRRYYRGICWHRQALNRYDDSEIKSPRSLLLPLNSNAVPSLLTAVLLMPPLQQWPDLREWPTLSRPHLLAEKVYPIQCTAQT